MKFVLLTLILVTTGCFVIPARAASTSNDSVKSDKHLGTNFDFEDQLVQGKYEYPDEATATVENEKGLNDLLSVRKEFKDRLSEMAERR